MIVAAGPRKICVLEDEATAEYTKTSVITGSAAAASPVPRGSRGRAVVEVIRYAGGMAPRALIGGEFIGNDDSAVLVIDVGVSDCLPAGQPVTCASRLWRPLVPGLPPEFADPSLAGMLRTTVLPPGDLHIDRAGYDEVDSSAHIFELTAQALTVVIAAMLRGDDLEEVATAVLNSWS